MSEQHPVDIALRQVADYAFEVRFEGTGAPPLRTDEPPPLGQGEGPNPSRLLVAAVANCLCASLLFALRKFHDAPGPLRASARGTVARNAKGRWRITAIAVELHLAEVADALPHLARALAQFEDFCVVTGSVRAAIEVTVRVLDADGRELHRSTG